MKGVSFALVPVFHINIHSIGKMAIVSEETPDKTGGAIVRDIAAELRHLVQDCFAFHVLKNYDLLIL